MSRFPLRRNHRVLSRSALAAAALVVGGLGGGAAWASSDGVGTAVTRSLQPGDEVAGPPFGVGTSERATVAESRDRLREAHAAVRTLREEVTDIAPQEGLADANLRAEAQRVMDSAQFAVQSLQHSTAVPPGDDRIRAALTSITEAQQAMLLQPGHAAQQLADLETHLADLTTVADQATDAPPPSLAPGGEAPGGQAD